MTKIRKLPRIGKRGGRIPRGNDFGLSPEEVNRRLKEYRASVPGLRNGDKENRFSYNSN
jgi:phosphosulfolactate phosphohydrolase-like enzyme